MAKSELGFTVLIGDEPVPLVPMRENHRGFVACSWRESFIQRNIKKMPIDIIKGYEMRIVTKLLSAGMAYVLEGSDRDTVHGWVCGKPGLLHYVYVAPEFQHMSVARQMIHGVCYDPQRPDRVEFTREWPGPPSRWPKWLAYNPYRAAETFSS